MVNSKARRGIILDRTNRIVTHFDAVADNMKTLAAAMGKVLTSLNSYMTGYSVNIANIVRWHVIDEAVKARYTSFIWIGPVNGIPNFTAETFQVEAVSEIFPSSRVPDRLSRRPKRTRVVTPVKAEDSDDDYELHWAQEEDRNNNPEVREAKLALLRIITKEKVSTDRFKITEYDGDDHTIVLRLHWSDEDNIKFGSDAF